MATVIRKTDPLVQKIADAHNDLKAQIGAASHFHLDKSEQTVTVADATDLPSALALSANIAAVLTFHRADTLAHKAADTTDSQAAAFPTDQTTLNTWLNEVKGDINTHIASTTYHYNADSTNTIAAANATDGATSVTLVNAIKAALNPHMADGPAAKSLRAVSA